MPPHYDSVAYKGQSRKETEPLVEQTQTGHPSLRERQWVFPTVLDRHRTARVFRLAHHELSWADMAALMDLADIPDCLPLGSRRATGTILRAHHCFLSMVTNQQAIQPARAFEIQGVRKLRARLVSSRSISAEKVRLGQRRCSSARRSRHRGRKLNRLQHMGHHQISKIAGVWSSRRSNSKFESNDLSQGMSGRNIYRREMLQCPW